MTLEEALEKIDELENELKEMKEKNKSIQEEVNYAIDNAKDIEGYLEQAKSDLESLSNNLNYINRQL